MDTGDTASASRDPTTGRGRPAPDSDAEPRPSAGDGVSSVSQSWFSAVMTATSNPSASASTSATPRSCAMQPRHARRPVGPCVRILHARRDAKGRPPEERASLPPSAAARYRQHVLDFARRLGRSVWFRAAVSLGLLALVVSRSTSRKQQTGSPTAAGGSSWPRSPWCSPRSWSARCAGTSTSLRRKSRETSAPACAPISSAFSRTTSCPARWAATSPARGWQPRPARACAARRRSSSTG